MRLAAFDDPWAGLTTLCRDDDRHPRTFRIKPTAPLVRVYDPSVVTSVSLSVKSADIIFNGGRGARPVFLRACPPGTFPDGPAGDDAAVPWRWRQPDGWQWAKPLFGTVSVNGPLDPRLLGLVGAKAWPVLLDLLCDEEDVCPPEVRRLAEAFRQHVYAPKKRPKRLPKP